MVEKLGHYNFSTNFRAKDRIDNPEGPFDIEKIA